jgi:hypothetical protein
MRIAPMAMLDASTTTLKGWSKPCNFSVGVVDSANFNASKHSCFIVVHLVAKSILFTVWVNGSYGGITLDE